MIHNPDTIPYELCPLCLSDRFNLVYIVDIRRHRSFKPHFHHEGYWMRCVECDHEFRDGRWKPTRLEEIYSVDDPSQFQHFDIRRTESSEVVNKISQYKQKGTWLDVGFGDGALLITAQEYGYDCFGLDYRKENITRLLDFGIESFDFNFLSLKVKKRFDVISMCDVLEHIDFPRDYITQAFNLLESSGLLLISCPNRQSRAWEYYTKNNENPYMKELEHYHNFTREGLKNFVLKNGFTFLSFTTNSRYKFGMDLIFRKPVVSKN